MPKIKPVKTMHIVRLIILTVLVGAFIPAIDAQTSFAAGCNGSSWQFQAPGACVIDYSDEGLSSGKSNPTIDRCEETFAGIKVSTGYDYMSYLAIPSIKSDGLLTPSGQLNVKLRIRQSCRVIPHAYLVTGVLIDPLGKQTVLPMISDELSYDSEYSTSVTNYCFTNVCGSTTYVFAYSLPNNLVSGSYSLKFSIVDNPNAYSGLKLPNINTLLSFTNSLFVGGETIPAPATTSSPQPTTNQIPLTDFTFSDSGEFLVCIMNDFTDTAIKTYGITGSHWRISSNQNGTTILDEYDWPLGVQSNGDTIKSYTENGASMSMLFADGVVRYSYGLRNQTAGVGYQCSIAVKTDHGIGRYISKDLIASNNVLNFNVVKVVAPTPTPSPSATKKVITCVKGKLIKKVSGANPVCPKGYKRK